MTKTEFLKWLERFKYVSHIRDNIERHKFTDDELDALRDRLETDGNLFVKKKWERKIMRWA